MSKTKKTNTRTKRAKKLMLGDVFEVFGVKYRVKRLVLIDGNSNNVSITAVDLATAPDLCPRHRLETEVLVVLNKDRAIPVLK